MNPADAQDWESGKTQMPKAGAAPSQQSAHSPFVLHERKRDGSLFIEQGSPSGGFHQAFDIHCDRPTAELLIRCVNSHQALVDALEAWTEWSVNRKIPFGLISATREALRRATQ